MGRRPVLLAVRRLRSSVGPRVSAKPLTEEGKVVTWADKLDEMRQSLERMVTECNADRQYDAALACQAALQQVASLDGVIEFAIDEKEWESK